MAISCLPRNVAYILIWKQTTPWESKDDSLEQYRLSLELGNISIEGYKVKTFWWRKSRTDAWEAAYLFKIER